MSTASPSGKIRIIPNEFPLRFKKHNFAAHCYNTIGCSVLYYNRYQARDEPGEISPPPRSANYQDYWGSAQIAIPNFPDPAIVEWQSLDGAPHRAEVDIGQIFRDERILHNVPQEDLPVETAATIGGPDIHLEVNDRTINVYMEAAVALKDTQTRKSDFRSDVILAWSHTY